MNKFSKFITSVVFILVTSGANAASLSFDMASYSASPSSQLYVTVIYDFIDTPSFGGGFNVIYDASVLEFVSYAIAPGVGPGSHDTVFSPVGMLDSPGNYLGAGVGATKLFTGINIRAPIGTFVFNVLGVGGDGGCGATLCLTPVPTNPMFTLAGLDNTAEVFANGITEARVVPIPAALWLMLSGTFSLALLFRKQQ